MMPRRLFLAGLLAAPAVIRSPGLLMPIRPLALSSAPPGGLLTPAAISAETLAIIRRNAVGGGRLDYLFARLG